MVLQCLKEMSSLTVCFAVMALLPKAPCNLNGLSVVTSSISDKIGWLMEMRFHLLPLSRKMNVVTVFAGLLF